MLGSDVTDYINSKEEKNLELDRLDTHAKDGYLSSLELAYFLPRLDKDFRERFNLPPRVDPGKDGYSSTLDLVYHITSFFKFFGRPQTNVDPDMEFDFDFDENEYPKH